MSVTRPLICIIFERIGPYHYARLRAAGRRGRVVALEVYEEDSTYAWSKVEGADSFRRITLLEGRGRASGRELGRKVEQKLDELQPDAVVVPGWADRAALAALSWTLANNRPAVLMSESQAIDEKRVWWKEGIKRRVVGLCAAGIVGGNPHLEYLTSLGMRGERVFTGYDVVDNDAFAAGADEARRAGASLRAHLGLPERYFLASNRFIEKKNIFRLLEAYARYRAKAAGEAWGLVLLGDGPLMPEVRRLVAELGVGDDVILPGFRQYDDIKCYYGLAGAFVHASTTEQWGLVVNEAMASGLPVLVSGRCGCAADLVHDGRNGFIFDPFDAGELADLMRRLSSGECDLDAMGRASREIIAGWAPEKFAENLWRAVDLTLDAPPPNAGLLDRAVLRSLELR